jgi:hypothetical protein
MNTNMVHNIINIAIAVIAALSVPEVVALFPAEWSIKIIGILGGAKMVINTIRDGLGGLWKPQPPVQK